MKKYSTENTDNDIVITLQGDGNYTYHGDHCVIRRIVESLHCAPKTNITLYIIYVIICYI